jgi:hypothetical protein
MNRRMMLMLAASSVALAACNSGGQPKTPDEVKADIASIGLLSQAVIASLRAIPQIPANTLNQAQSVVADIQANADRVAAAITASPLDIQTIATDIDTLQVLVSPYFPQASPYAAALIAAVYLAGALAQAAGVVPVKAAATTSGMTKDKARAAIKAALAK